MPADGASAPVFEQGTLPYRTAWGPYTIIADRFRTRAGGEGERVRIVDARRRVVREVNGFVIAGLTFIELTGAPPTELRIDIWSGAAHCCTTSYFFRRDPAVRNVLIFEGGSGRITEIRDLDGDGWAEVIADNDALAYYYSGALPYTLSPTVAIPRPSGAPGTWDVSLQIEYPGGGRTSRVPGGESWTAIRVSPP